MELKKDCIRDVLFYLEENLEYDSFISVDSIQLDNHFKEDIFYACEKLNEAGFINAEIHKYISGEWPSIIIFSITYDGHQFLDNIRSPKIWKETMEKLEAIGGFSLNIIGQVAVAIIQSKLGL